MHFIEAPVKSALQTLCLVSGEITQQGGFCCPIHRADIPERMMPSFNCCIFKMKLKCTGLCDMLCEGEKTGGVLELG